MGNICSRSVCRLLTDASTFLHLLPHLHMQKHQRLSRRVCKPDVFIKEVSARHKEIDIRRLQTRSTTREKMKQNAKPA